MRICYIDTSILLSVAFDEISGRRAIGRFSGFDRFVSANLLKAEFRSVCFREQHSFTTDDFFAIDWIFSREPLKTLFWVKHFQNSQKIHR